MPEVVLSRQISIDKDQLPSLSDSRNYSDDDSDFDEPRHHNELHLYQPQGHPKQALIEGEIWPPVFKPRNVRSAKNLEVLDNDIFVVTYPKCGTTWIQHICSQLIHQKYNPKTGRVSELCMTSPMIERMGSKYVKNVKHPRILKTHFTYENCPKNTNAKYIFAVRNPKDCLASYYFHHKNFVIYNWKNGNFNTFFDLFTNGKLGFGDYFDHLQSWFPHIHDSNVLFLKYEDMCADLESAVVQIGNFIGGKAAEVVNNYNTLQQVVHNSKIESMKMNQERWFKEDSLHQKTFIRKGASRDWTNHMSYKQSIIIDELFKNKMAGTEAVVWWQYEMCWDYSEALKIAIAEIKIKMQNQTLPPRITTTKDTIAEAATTISSDFSYPILFISICSDSEVESESTSISSSSSALMSPDQSSTSDSSRRSSLELNIATREIPSVSLLTVKPLAKNNDINDSSLFVKPFTGIDRRDSSISIASSGYESIAE